eukprot:gene32353-41005_t
MVEVEDAEDTEQEEGDDGGDSSEEEEEEEEIFIVEKLGPIRWFNGVRHFWVKWK